MNFPELSEQGNQDALHLIERFKSKVRICAEETISELYCNLLPHIETDSWTNYREQCRLELYKFYVKSETASVEEAWASSVREAIFKEYRAELEKGIIADLNKRISNLEEIIRDRYK